MEERGMTVTDLQQQNKLLQQKIYQMRKRMNGLILHIRIELIHKNFTFT